eukprot:TRINITY_DN1215_c0_g1_i1.p1 TRINITY_DN1215_c0_g1~~TRINITY_DN1215_c0_g1_i1.p1  ORF type:complete len:539 (+),score=149.94 TRINITY_DN1215_c0_g1_i1:59-1618(+)
MENMKMEIVGGEDDGSQLGAVYPVSCAHIKSLLNQPKTGDLKVSGKCDVCEDASENWCCLTCYKVFCSRFVKGHMKEHAQKENHNLCVSFQDLSFWCFACDSYVKGGELFPIYSELHKLKFGIEPGQERGTTRDILQIQRIMQPNDKSDSDTEGEEDEIAVAKAKTGLKGKWWIAGLDEKVLKNKVVDQILGCLYGNALGDAYGLSTEFEDKPAVIRAYGDSPVPFPNYKKTFHNSRWDTGDWTDDTDQMILIMQTILEHNGEVNESTFAQKLRRWVNRGFPELGDHGGMGLGATVAQVVFSKNFLEDPHKAAEEVWYRMDKNAAANGAIMRTSICGVAHYADTTKVIEDTIRMCRVTHHDSRCVASTVLVDVCLALMLQGRPCKTSTELRAILDEALSIAHKYIDPEHKEAFDKHVVTDDSVESLEKLDLDESRAIGYTLKCMGAGLWCFFSQRNFKETFNLLVREAGDADTNGAIAGALFGCKVGYSQLPKDWLEALPNKAWYDKQVVELLKLMKVL